MNVGIVGSRNFTDELVMDMALNDLMVWANPVAIVSGGAVGADAMAASIVKAIGLKLIEHLPDKERYGWPRAAFERNTLIVRDSDILLAFFGPGEPPIKGDRHFGSGTMDTVTKAIVKRIPVHLYFQQDDG